MKLLKIYVGNHLINGAGLLFGISLEKESVLILTYIIPWNDYHQLSTDFRKKMKPLGILNFQDNDIQKYIPMEFPYIFPVLSIKSKEMIDVKYFPDKKEIPETIILFYNANEITKSLLLDSDYMPPKNIQATSIYFALQDCHSKVSKINYSKNENFLNEFNEKTPPYFISILFYFAELYGVVLAFLNSRIAKRVPASVVPAIIFIFCKKSQNFIDISLHTKSHFQSRIIQQRYYNFLFMTYLDSCLGIAFLILILSTFDSFFIANSLLTWIEWIAAELIILLNWLMSFPGGLKLNQPLAEFLGKFFLYHIQLWKDYLRLLYPLWSEILRVCLYSGIFGFTFQIALLRDLLSIMTLHTYCFYVYAARLYFVLFSALKSLFRLFLGKKWNILRKRVDTMDYELDQLFVGTLLFTIFLFLVPTVTLFYIVFCTMRLVVLTSQGLLELIQKFVVKFPLYFVLLQLISPSYFSDQTYLFVIQGKPLCLHYQVKSVSMISLYNIAHNKELYLAFPWKNLFCKIITGELINPWIDSKEIIN